MKRVPAQPRTAMPGMLDLPAPARDLRWHPCEHPGCAERWGAFGIGFGEDRRWFCFAHKDQGAMPR